jgi:hypothetical protein
VALAGPAAADVFTVRGVEVDETSNSAAAARERAISVGQQIAAQRLLERLTLPEDRAAPAPGFPGAAPGVDPSLDPSAAPIDPAAGPTPLEPGETTLDPTGAPLDPNAAPSLLAPAVTGPRIDPAVVARMVSGFQVEEEALAGSRYLGRLTVTFDPDAVQDWLDSLGIPYVLSSARPAVIVPLWREGEQTILWDGANPWFEAWSIAGTADELVPVLAPSGDLADISVIDAPRALALDRAALQALAANYGSAHVLIALAGPAPGAAPTPGLEADPAAGAPLPADPAAPVDPAAQPAPVDPSVAPTPAPALPPGTPIAMRMVGIDFAHGGQPVDYGSLTAVDPVELARAAAGLLQDGWKRSLVTAAGAPPTTASLNVLYSNFQEWAALQEVIGTEPLFLMRRLDGVTNDGALMTVQYRGTQEQLALVLREHGAELTGGPGGLVVTWVPPLGAPQPGAMAPGAMPSGAAPTVGPADVDPAAPGETVDPAAEETLYE